MCVFQPFQFKLFHCTTYFLTHFHHCISHIWHSSLSTVIHSSSNSHTSNMYIVSFMNIISIVLTHFLGAALHIYIFLSFSKRCSRINEVKLNLDRSCIIQNNKKNTEQSCVVYNKNKNNYITPPQKRSLYNSQRYKKKLYFSAVAAAAANIQWSSAMKLWSSIIKLMRKEKYFF